eukprot:Transcript_28406.p1 GENE.Transcript_28406~~Transcript_28406.p1  ORF type:complete len:735 (+),score=129.99 Transcript_28406:138-2342(+)
MTRRTALLVPLFMHCVSCAPTKSTPPAPGAHSNLRRIPLLRLGATDQSCKEEYTCIWHLLNTSYPSWPEWKQNFTDAYHVMVKAIAENAAIDAGTADDYTMSTKVDLADLAGAHLDLDSLEAAGCELEEECTSGHAEEAGCTGGDECTNSSAQLEALKAGKGAVSLRKAREDAEAAASYTAGAGRPWTDGKVNYCFAPSAASTDKVVRGVRLAARQFAKMVPCVTITEVDLDPDDNTKCKVQPAILVMSDNVDGGCWSMLGMVNAAGTQKLNLAHSDSGTCAGLGTIMHEFLHAMGQLHEQSRPDRDTYVTVNTDNIKPSYVSQYNTNDDADVGRDYDMLSIMHYGDTYFRKAGNTGKTMVAKDAAKALITDDQTKWSSLKFGNRVGPTQSDANQLAEQYGCLPLVSIRQAATCKDLTLGDVAGTAWTDTSGSGCDGYGLVAGKKDCDNGAGAKLACCSCGGGISTSDWVASNAPRSPPPSPRPPPSPPPPSPPPPPQDCQGCDNGNKGGKCLMALPKKADGSNNDDCPTTATGGWTQSAWDSTLGCSSTSLADGGVCALKTSADFGMGITYVNNCGASTAVYRMVECYAPPPSPSPPPTGCAEKINSGYSYPVCWYKAKNGECPYAGCDYSCDPTCDQDTAYANSCDYAKTNGWCNQGYAWSSGGGICSKKADQPSWVTKTDCSCDYSCNTATAHETAAKRRSLQKDKQTPKHGEAHILAPAEEHEGIIMAEH